MTRAELEAKAEQWRATRSRPGSVDEAEELNALLIETFNAGVLATDAKLAERHNHHDRDAVRSLLIGGA